MSGSPAPMVVLEIIYEKLEMLPGCAWHIRGQHCFHRDVWLASPRQTGRWGHIKCGLSVVGGGRYTGAFPDICSL